MPNLCKTTYRFFTCLNPAAFIFIVTLFTKVNPARAIKKARVIEMEQPTDITKSNQILQVAPQLDASLVNLPGSFAEKTVDQGALVFIEHFNQLPNAQKVLDLGCGNGILSLAYLKTHAPTELFLVDENNQALKSAQINLAKAAPTSKVTYCHSNSLNELSTQTFELIICNPPFHQENTLTEKIAEKMFVDVANALEKDGQFWMVANRHLTYYTSLKKHFRDVHIKSKHAKFNVFCCRH